MTDESGQSSPDKSLDLSDDVTDADGTRREPVPGAKNSSIKADGLGRRSVDSAPTPFPRMSRPSPPQLIEEDLVESSQSELIALQRTSMSTEKRPYINSFPEGYVAEHLILDWIEFLVFESGIDRARASFEYYDDIGWIGDGAVETLKDYADTFSGVDIEDSRPLTLDHHRVSLVYVARLVSMG